MNYACGDVVRVHWLCPDPQLIILQGHLAHTMHALRPKYFYIVFCYIFYPAVTIYTFKVELLSRHDQSLHWTDSFAIHAQRPENHERCLILRSPRQQYGHYIVWTSHFSQRMFYVPILTHPCNARRESACKAIVSAHRSWLEHVAACFVWIQASSLRHFELQATSTSVLTKLDFFWIAWRYGLLSGYYFAWDQLNTIPLLG